MEVRQGILDVGSSHSLYNSDPDMNKLQAHFVIQAPVGIAKSRDITVVGWQYLHAESIFQG